jgi:pterin-4a-carbinolamine dehydratase
MPALTTEQVSLRLKAIPDWSKRAKTICRTFQFEGFTTGIAFVRRIAKQAHKSIITRILIFVLTR